jgi:hypothetical protein
MDHMDKTNDAEVFVLSGGQEDHDVEARARLDKDFGPNQDHMKSILGVSITSC